VSIIDIIPNGPRTTSGAGGVGATTALVDRALQDAGGAGTIVYGLHPDGRAQHYGAHINAVSSWRGVAPAVPASPNNKIGLSFRIWLIANCASASIPFAGVQTAAGNFISIRQNTSATHDLEINIPTTGTPTSVVANPTTAFPYWIDMLVDVSGTTHAVDVWVNGVSKGQFTATGMTATTISNFREGNTLASGTCDYWISDVIAYDYADGRLGDHYIVTLYPSASGTHVMTAGDFTDDAAANVSVGETTSWAKVDEWPANTTDYVRQVVTRTTSYLEYQFQSLPNNCHLPKYVTAYAAMFPVASTQANKIAFRLNDVFGGAVSSEATWDASIASNTLEYHRHGYLLTPGGSAWSASAINQLRIRAGFSDDASPAEGLSAFGIDVVVETRQTNPVGQVSETDTAQALTRQKRTAVGQVTVTNTAQPITRGAAPHNINVGQVSEADTAQAIARRKAKAIGQPSEGDTAQAITRRKSKAVGQVSETDSAQQIKPAHARTLGQPSEADTAQATGRRKSKAVGLPTEADTAQPVTGRKSKAVGQVTVTSTAQPIRPAHARTLGEPVETDSVQPIARRKTRAVGQVTEADTAQSIAKQKRVPLGLVTETDSAQPVGKREMKAIGQVSEADTAQPVARRKTRTTGLVSETDSVNPITRPGSFGQVSEVDTAQPITRRKTKTTGQVAEADTAQSIKVAKARTIGQVSEVDSVQAVTRRKSRAVGQPVETDTAQAVTRRKSKTVGQVSEADSVQPVQRRKSKVTGQALETDTAQAIGRRRQTTISIIAESDSAQPIRRVKRVTIGMVTESDSPMALGRTSVRAVGLVSENDTAQAFNRRRSHELGLVTEADSALSIRPPLSGIVGPPVGAQVI
jgi:hypothetical protein